MDEHFVFTCCKFPITSFHSSSCSVFCCQRVCLPTQFAPQFRALLADMGGEVDFEAELDEALAAEQAALAPMPKPEARPRKGSGKRKRAEAAEVAEGAPLSAKQLKRLCFICPETKLNNSRFCRPHHRAMEAMKYQAVSAKAPP